MARMRSMATFSFGARSGTASASRIFASASLNFFARINSSAALSGVAISGRKASGCAAGVRVVCAWRRIAPVPAIASSVTG